MRAFLLAPTLVAVLVPALAFAQPRRSTRLHPVAPGERVRVTLSSGSSVIGALVSADSSGVTVRASDSTAAPTTVPRADVKRLEYFAGVRTHPVRAGIGGGALIGAAIGVIIGGVTYSQCVSHEVMDCFMQPDNQETAMAVGAVEGVIPGMILGGIIGHNRPREIWRRAALPDGTTVGVRGEGRRFALAVRMTF